MQFSALIEVAMHCCRARGVRSPASTIQIRRIPAIFIKPLCAAIYRENQTRSAFVHIEPQ
jgi:hypothetical protein